jgi:hypothetical protein
MSRRTTLVTIAVLVAAAATALAALAPAGARGASNCGDAVLQEWSSGGIRRAFPLRCYGEALRRMPQDIRSYSTATDDIQRALLARQRSKGVKRDAGSLGAAAPASASHSSSATPYAVLGAVGLALFLLAAGSAGIALRKLRGR